MLARSTFRPFGICACFLIALGALGVSACTPEDDDAASDASRLTVTSGARYIVTAKPEKVVVWKTVDGTPFPFDADGLVGKAILIHPVAGKADDGVYSRVTGVTEDAKTYTLTGDPLSFTEMENITEDEVVRIYLDPKQESDTTAKLGAPVLTPDSFGLAPQGLVSGLPFGSFGTDAALDTTSAPMLGVIFQQTIEQASFKPSVLFNWSKETGLELGFRAQMDWKSKATIRGKVTGEFFRSNAYEAFGTWVFVPVGIVPIPIRAGVRLRVQCKAELDGPVGVTLDIETHARVGGSFRVRPSLDTAPSDWVTEGQWPREVSGSAHIDPAFDFALGGKIWCSLPRIELHTEIFGVVGPVVIVAPTAVLDMDGFHPELQFSAGLTASLFGIGKNAALEVPVYTVKF